MAVSSPKPVFSGASTTQSGIQSGALKQINETLDSLISEGFDILDQGFQQGIDILLQGGGTDGVLSSFAQGGAEAFERALSFQGIGPTPFSPEELEQQFLSTPGAQFQLEQGRKAVEASASSKGLLGSGRAAKELQRQGQGQAAQQFGQRQAELSQLAQLGAQAAGLDVQQRTQAAGLLSQQAESKAGLLQNAQTARTSALSQQKTETTTKTGVRLGNLFITAGAAGA